MYTNNDDEFLQDLNNLPSQIATHEPIDIDSVEDENTTQVTQLVAPESSDDNSLENPPVSIPPVSSSFDEDVERLKADKTQEYILDACKKIVTNGYDTLASIQDTVIATVDGKAINGYATLIGSLAKVLDTANSIANNKLQLGNQVRIEKMRAALKQSSASQANKTTNNINIVAGREEIMKMLDSIP